MSVATAKSCDAPVQGLGGEWRREWQMSRLSSWRVGGAAEWVYTPSDQSDLQRFLAERDRSIPVHVVGLGSNLLVRDGGVRGIVLRTAPGLSSIRREGDDICAEAGVGCPKLARVSSEEGLGGAEFFCGIPGSIGGALAMNAGCFGSETWDVVTEAVGFNEDGTQTTITPDTVSTGYRHVQKPKGMACFVSGRFRLRPGEPQEIKDRIAEMLKRRKDTQPIGTANSGSVFLNPADAKAGALIEESGLKGFRVGGAAVSEKHANFIVNSGDATAADIENLIEHIRGTVLKRSGISLKTEVRIIGEAA